MTEKKWCTTAKSWMTQNHRCNAEREFVKSYSIPGVFEYGYEEGKRMNEGGSDLVDSRCDPYAKQITFESAVMPAQV